jgi:hypothetical protein
MSNDDVVPGIESERVLARQVGSQLLGLLPRSFDRIVMKTSMAGGVMAGETVMLRADGSEESALPAKKTFDAARSLRELMYEPDSGTWFTAVFTVTGAGKLSAEYDYDTEPEIGHFAAEAWRADFEEFPRTPENTPAWLEAILSGAPTRHDP